MHRIAVLILAALVGGADADAQETARIDPPVVRGLDHIPLAVKDLEGASARYRSLGFTLKPGRPHDNGIRNQHVKFPDGTEIELITAPEARDPLTTAYLRHLEDGDGPAFVGFFAPEMDAVARRLEGSGLKVDRGRGLLSFSDDDDLRYIFFGHRNRSPTDRPEHFLHANGAEAMIGIWIASDDLSTERRLLETLGATFTSRDVFVPERLGRPVARFDQAEVILLPSSYQLVRGRRIVGATLRTRDLENLRRILEAGAWDVPHVVQTANGRSLFLPPSRTHGIWLEFREERPLTHRTRPTP